MRRGAVVAALAVVLVAAATGSTTASLARFTDASASADSVTTDTLDPPTGLVAEGGTAVTLAWTPTLDARASGYAVLRSATAGAGHVAVATVTPSSAASTTDSPGPGTWYYLLASVFAGWTSVPSNEASATVTAPSASTAFAPCVSQYADSSGAGDNNGYEGSPARACASDDLYATDSNSGSGAGGAASASCGTGATPSATEDRHRFWGFVHGLPTSVTTITGIEVQADLALNNNSGANNLCVQLSWDGGATWTTIQARSVASTPKQTYLFGGATDTWGRTWAVAELDPAAFRVRVIDASSTTTKQFRLDYLAVRVHYAEP